MPREELKYVHSRQVTIQHIYIYYLFVFDLINNSQAKIRVSIYILEKLTQKKPKVYFAPPYVKLASMFLSIFPFTSQETKTLSSGFWAETKDIHVRFGASILGYHFEPVHFNIPDAGNEGARTVFWLTGQTFGRSIGTNFLIIGWKLWMIYMRVACSRSFVAILHLAFHEAANWTLDRCNFSRQVDGWPRPLSHLLQYFIFEIFLIVKPRKKAGQNGICIIPWWH